MEWAHVDPALSSESTGFDYESRRTRPTARLQSCSACGWRGVRTRIGSDGIMSLIVMQSISTSEYSSVRDGGAGLIDLSARGRILVSGSEAVMFLNGLITNDIKSLAVNSWMPAAFANVQGRLLAVVRIVHRENGFLIDTEE